MNQENNLKSSLARYFGVPVLVQLKNYPIVAVQVQFKNRIPHSAEPDRPQWVPEAVMQQVGPGQEAPSLTQLIQYAVLNEVPESETHVELVWMAQPPDPRAPSSPLQQATIATLIRMDEILSVTRIVSVHEARSPIVIAKS